MIIDDIDIDLEVEISSTFSHSRKRTVSPHYGYESCVREN
jgi:hypothetical protein